METEIIIEEGYVIKKNTTVSEDRMPITELQQQMVEIDAKKAEIQALIDAYDAAQQ